MPLDFVDNAALYEILVAQASALSPRSYLEIGCREGDSLLTVIRNASSLDLAVVCDTWQSEYGGSGHSSPDHILSLLAAERFPGHVLFLNGFSQALLPYLSASFDLILVDGDHSLEGASADLTNSWPLLRPGGVLVMDDLTHAAHSYLRSLFHQFADKVGAEVIAESVVGSGCGALRKK